MKKDSALKSVDLPKNLSIEVLGLEWFVELRLKLRVKSDDVRR